MANKLKNEACGNWKKNDLRKIEIFSLKDRRRKEWERTKKDKSNTLRLIAFQKVVAFYCTLLALATVPYILIFIRSHKSNSIHNINLHTILVQALR